MPINFSNLVLRPCMDTFAGKIHVDPVSSRPGEQPYDMRAIYTTKRYDFQSMDGAVLTDQQTTLGLRYDDFDGPPPSARDKLMIDDPVFAAHGVSGRYLVDDFILDGQGGGVLTIHKVVPDYPR